MAEKKTRLSRVNTLLMVLIVLIDGYIALAPFFPIALYDWQRDHGEQTKLERSLHPIDTSKTAPVQPNRVVIPSMLLNAPIYEGPVYRQYQILNQGIWRWPLGSTPDKGGNTVLIGHRFTYTNPRGIFYFLNKVSIGNEIGVWWNNKEYLYKVASVNVVPPTDTLIESSSKRPVLTLFTCTPLWFPKNRLVVIAYPEIKK